jgi:protein-tyrosine-phosphatase
MAEALLRARLADVAPEVTVGSAGLLFDDRPAEHHAVKALRHRGIELGSHRAQRLEHVALDEASLILGMERMHVRAVIEPDEHLFARSFTLPEFVRSAAVFGPRPADEDLRAWVERIGAVRSRAGYEHDDPLNIIADPMGQSRRAFRETADEIDALLEELVLLAWPEPQPGDPAVAPTSGGIHADRDRR